MTATVPTLTRARAIAEVMIGDKPNAVADRYGVTVQSINGWRRDLETDDELRLAVSAALRHAMGGWRAQVSELIVDLVHHVRSELEKPDALDAETALGAIRSLGGVIGQVDLLAKRHGLDVEPPPPQATKAPGEKSDS